MDGREDSGQSQTEGRRRTRPGSKPLADTVVAVPDHESRSGDERPSRKLKTATKAQSEDSWPRPPIGGHEESRGWPATIRIPDNTSRSDSAPDKAERFPT